MKKIYILTAVLALLTLSLNAQQTATKNVAKKAISTFTVDKRVQEKVATPPDGYFRMGPSRASTTPVTPPYSNSFGSSTDFAWWEAINNNNDSYTWALYNNNAARLHWNSSDAADDWLVTAPITLQAGRTYKFYIDTWAESGSRYPERLEVKMAATNTATALTNGTTIIGQTTVTASSSSPQHLSNENITVSTSGNYYIGIHGISDPDMYYLYVDNFVIDVVVTDPVITASSSTVNLTSAPNESATETVTVTGSNLTTGITASISGNDAALFSLNTYSLGTSGGNLTVTYSPTAVGTHTATLTLSSSGAEPVNIALNGSCTIESDLTVCNGQYYAQYLPLLGYYHDEAQHNQMIYPASMLTSIVGKTIKSMTFYPTTGSVTWSGGTTESASGINFYNGSVCFKLANISSGSSFDANNPSFVNATLTEVKTVSMPSSANSSATTWLITFNQGFVYTGGDLLIDVTNPTTGQWGLTFFTVDDTGDNYYGYINTGAGNGALNYLPKVTFTYEGEPNPVHDLAIALDAQPTTVAPGSTVTLTATVTNNGNQPENGYTVTFSANGTTIDTQTANTALAAGASTTFTYTYTTTDAQANTTVTFGASVACTDDADASNNEATASTSVLTCPPPENVQATDSNQSGTMTWDAPTIGMVPGTLIWDFEENTDLAEFTTIDSDGDGYNWSWHYNSGSGNYTVHQGNGVAYSESFHNNDDGQTGVALSPNNWMISPEITLGGSLTFWAAHQASYPENFAVYVCQGPYSDVSSFTKVYGDITTTSTMTEHTVDLSQYSGQGYFAIRHYNVSDKFILLIDDIACQTMVPGEQPSSYNIYLDGVLVGNVPSTDFSYTFNNVSTGQHQCAVSAVYSYGESVAVPANFTILPTPNAPAVSSNDGTTSTTITITPDANTDGQLVYSVVYNGSQTQDLTFPRGANDYTVEVHAYTTATSNYNQSPEAVVTVTIPALPQTAAPTIAISSQTDNNVTITATGNGTVILNIPGYPQATGNGSASITVPRHMSDYVVTATATAQASGELVSTTTTQNITVPGMTNDGWTEMTETYNNPNDLLSFKVKVGNDTTDIMLIDQFLASTVFNNHPSSYTYVLKETKVINGMDSTMTSNPADIPVYKTNSTMRGLYTEAQVLADDYADEANRLTANAVNAEMDYDVVPDNNVLYYSLYRGGIQEQTPAIDEPHRISQLQKYEDKVGDNVMYYFTENHPTGILPRYDHSDNIGSQTVERLDVDYVTGATGDQLSYVPVIWTFGLYTARGDGKNNSYGSDIKYNELGGVDVSSEIIVNWSDNNKMEVNGVDYYVVSPVITLDAVAPELEASNDGESYEYVPYMYRVWCTYTDAHNFGHAINPDGINYSLVETGLIDAPFCIGEVAADTISDPTHVEIGKDLGHVSPQTQWSFAVTKEAALNNDIEFVVRYYYKKVVTEAAGADQPAGMRGNRDGGADYAIYETRTSSSDIVTGINELWSGYGKVVISQTYVNAQGMQSDKPFDGLNIVVTRFSDGTTTTTKVVR